ncbi:MAG: carbohydrate ABC transporter permease [Faecalibacterium sp.]
MKPREIIFEIIMIALVLGFLYPFFIMFFVSVKSAREALLSPSSFPSEFHFENYAYVWETMNFSRIFFNSFFVTGLSVLGIVVLAGMAGYVIAKTNTKFYKFLYLFILSGIMIPFYTCLVPVIKLATQLGFTNSLIGLVIIYWGRSLPMATFLYVGFIRGIPNEIIESATVDGANLWVCYWRVVFPMLKSITSTIVILNALSIWNDFLLPSLLISKSAYRTLPLCQYYFQQGEFGSAWQYSFSAYILAMVPILILYIFLQKYIIKGISAGAVKG